MPFIYDQTNVEWTEDGLDQPSPRASEFMYLPPPEFGGAAEPVHFSIAAPVVESAAHEPQRTTTSKWRAITDRLFGRPQRPTKSYEEESQQRGKLHDDNRQRLFAILIPELRKTGVRRVYCRYDGGNDEGFSWLDSAEMQNGERINASVLPQRLDASGILDRLAAGKVIDRRGGAPDQQQMEWVLRDWLCNEWASMLLGSGFGTGEYSMYGAFTVDLEACTITDDPGAAPIVENIQIAE